MTEPIPVEASLRGRLGDAVAQIPGLDTLIQIVSDATQAVRKVRVSGYECAKCGVSCPHVHYVEVPDAKNARETLAFVMEQTEGRPGVADVEDAGVVVRRTVVGLDE